MLIGWPIGEKKKLERLGIYFGGKADGLLNLNYIEKRIEEKLLGYLCPRNWMSVFVSAVHKTEGIE